MPEIWPGCRFGGRFGGRFGARRRLRVDGKWGGGGGAGAGIGLAFGGASPRAGYGRVRDYYRRRMAELGEKFTDEEVDEMIEFQCGDIHLATNYDEFRRMTMAM